MKKASLFITLLTAACCCSASTIIYEDNFDRTDGSVVNTTVSSGTYKWAYYYSGGSVNIANNALVFASSGTGNQGNYFVSSNLDKIEKYTVSFDVSAKSNIGDGEFLFYIRPRATYTTQWNNAYRFGVTSGGSVSCYVYGPNQSLGIVFNSNETIHVEYSIDGNNATATIGGVTHSTYATSGTYNDGISDYFIFGVASTDTKPNFTMDNLVVMEVPEPATMSLIAIGGMCVFFRRRK